MGKIEAQSVRAHQGTCLLDMVPEHLAQGGVQQVGGTVVGLCVGAALFINDQFHLIAGCQTAFLNRRVVQDDPSASEVVVSIWALPPSQRISPISPI